MTTGTTDTKAMQIGDVVRLNSDQGPTMTVVGLHTTGDLSCAWFNEVSGKFEREHFSPNCLMKCEPPSDEDDDDALIDEDLS